jgi:hypothetical protein
VESIDRHGLKQRHLQRHTREVEAFFQSLSHSPARSEAAEALQKRLLKCRDKLFTFLDHDGVPWNNNNAENAIKRFARYREQANGHLKEAGLSEFLVLLSICQTCRYKGVSFLKFLLSKEKDLDSFCNRRPRRRRPPTVEVYPKGFIPPHYRRREEAKQRKAEGSPVVGGLDQSPGPERGESE